MLNTWRRRLSAYRDVVFAMHDLMVRQVREDARARSTNPLARAGAKMFSQADEDGITLEVLHRLGIENGTYCEFGVGDGLECNTIVLAAMGWRGFWVSGEQLAFESAGRDRFHRHYKRWVDHDNLLPIFEEGKAALEIADVDVISFDFDGNDLFFIDALLSSGTRPGLFIVEYNARFLPPVRWSVPRDPAFTWNGTDFMGASLQSFVDMFGRHGYMLIACNTATGANAFFVRQEQAAAFSDVPRDIRQLYQPPNYALPLRYGHVPDAATVERALTIGASIAAGTDQPELTQARS